MYLYFVGMFNLLVEFNCANCFTFPHNTLFKIIHVATDISSSSLEMESELPDITKLS